MGNTTLPIPLELIFDVLQRCTRKDVYHFALTSKTSYDSSVHLLYKHIDLAVAVESGALERHQKYGVNNFVQIVDIPIGFSSPDFFADVDPVNTIKEHLLKFKNIQELHLVIAEHDYQLGCVTEMVLRYVFADYISRLSTIFLEIHGEYQTIDALQSILTVVRQSIEGSIPEHHQLKSIRAWVTCSQPRKLMSFVTPLFSPFMSKVERVQVWTRCNLELNTDRDLWFPDRRFTYLRQLASKSVRFAAIEDKNSSSSRTTCKFVQKHWPNIEELELDLGVNHDLAPFVRLSKLKHLRKLKIMYPYQSWSDQVQGCMAEEARCQAEQLCKFILPLQEVAIKYMCGNGSMSQIAVFNRIRTKLTSNHATENEFHSDEVQLELKELRDEKGNHEDVIDMMKLVRELGTVLPYESRARIEKYILVNELKAQRFSMRMLEGESVFRVTINA